MNYQKDILPNGLRLITVPMESLKSVTVLILIGTGSRYETREINGISHFLEHMVYKGTKRRPNPIDIPSEIEGIGGAWNAFTEKDHTGFYIKAGSEHLEQILDILTDVLRNSLMKEEEIGKEKGVIVEEINMYEDLPMQKAGEVFEELMYGDVPLGWDILGKPETVRRFTREHFRDYWDSHYTPSNTVVVVAGDVDISQPISKSSNNPIEELAKKYLGEWEDGEAGKAEKTIVTQSGPRVKIKYKKTEQAHICFGVPAYPLGHPERYNFALLTTILGGGASSRLFDEVREKRGLAYYLQSSSNQYRDVGHFVTQGGIVLNKVEETIAVILNQLYLLRESERSVASEELIRAKELLKGHLILSLEDSKNVAAFFGIDELLERKTRTPEQILEKIDAVSSDGIVRVARDLFRTEKLNLSIIGPYDDPERLQKLLHF